MPNKNCIDHDGTTLWVYSDDEVVLQTPFSEGVGDPASMVGIDAATLLPATFPAPARHDVRLPDGTRKGQLLWWDGEAWHLLDPGAGAGYVLTEQADGADLVPVWQPVAGITPWTAAQRQCGIAWRLSGQIVQAYSWLTSTALTALSAAINTGGGESSVITELTSVFTGPFAVLVSGANAIAANWAESDWLVAAQQYGPLTPGQSDGVRAAVYCGLRDLGDALTLTSDTLAAIQARINAYPNWSSTQQRDLLSAVLDALPLSNWQYWAAQGAADPSHACDGEVCP